MFAVSANVILNLDRGEEKAAVSIDATADGAVPNDEIADHEDCDRVDAFVELIRDEDSVEKMDAISDAGFTLFGVETEQENDGGLFLSLLADDWEDDWKLELTWRGTMLTAASIAFASLPAATLTLV